MSKSNKPKNSKSKNNKSNIISQTADNEGIITHAIVEAYQMIEQKKKEGEESLEQKLQKE